MAAIDRIKWDSASSDLVYKWPSDSLTLGSQVIVNESQEAIFYKSGQALDLLGPGTHMLETANIPLLKKLINAPFGGETPFTAEVYLINKNLSLAHGWGTQSPVMIRDAEYKIPIPVRGYGTYALRVTNSWELVVQIAGAKQGATTAAEISTKLLNSPINACMQQGIGDYLIKKKIPVLEIASFALEISDHVQELLKNRYQNFGVELVNFTIESISFDEEHPNFVRLSSHLDEAARLNIEGQAFRSNEDYYRAERQYDVLGAAAQNSGAAGALMSGAMGLGMGFGTIGAVNDVTRQAMSPAATKASDVICSNCQQANPSGTKYCLNCGQIQSSHLICSSCTAENLPTSKFCAECGHKISGLTCQKCNAALSADAKFCPECGEKR